MKLIATGATLFLSSVLAAAAPIETEWALIKKVPVPGDGGYDYLYVDDAARRLYVSHGPEVAVLDADSQAVVGIIKGLNGTHGIVVVPEVKKGFITNGKSSTITIFDPKTLKISGEIISTGKNPDALIYDPASRKVFVFNHSSGNVTVFDPNSGKVTSTIDVGGALEFGRADGKGAVWVNVEDKNQVARIDSKTMRVTARWPLTPCEEPTGMALDKKHRRLFVGCNEKMAVLNADTGNVISTLPIGKGVDATDFDASTGDIYNSCGGDGTMVVIHQDGADTYHVASTVKTQPRAKTLTLDPKTHRVFLSAAIFPPAKGPAMPGTFAVLVYGKSR